MQLLKDYLSRLPHYKEEEFDQVKNHFRSVLIETGVPFIQKGQVCKYVGFVQKGLFKTIMKNNGKPSIIDFTAGSAFICDYKSLIGQEPSSLDIVATEDSEVLVMEANILFQLYRSSSFWQTWARSAAQKQFDQIKSAMDGNAKVKPINKLNKLSPDLVRRIANEDLSIYANLPISEIQTWRSKA